MKKVFYISLIVFFLSGVALFYLIDRNSDTIKSKVKDKFGNVSEHGGIIINSANDELESIEKDFSKDNKELSINIGVGELKIESYEGETIKVKSLIPKKAINAYSTQEINNTLIIKGNVAHEVLVLIPRGYELGGEIKLGIGDFYGENLKNIKIEVNTGNLVGKNLSDVKKLKLDLGDLELISSKNIERIELKTGSAKIEILEQDRDFVITNNLGDLNLTITNKFDGQIDSRVKLGDINLNNLNPVGKKYRGNVTLDLGELTITGIN